MSATRDQSQKVTFIFNNLYKDYLRGKAAASAADVRVLGTATSMVLKVKDAHASEIPKIRKFEPRELLAKRRLVESVRSLPGSVSGYQPIMSRQADAVASLMRNYQQLNELQSKLQFMLKELEELVKE